jgi:lipopolysaccharide/colanic/teichoic acid biosynthesis glycosyltransferase
MLRIFRQYYPIRNIFFVLGEGAAIYISVLLASRIIFGSSWWMLKGQSYLYLNLKIMLMTVICQLCLYYNDLYDLKVTDTFLELAIRLLQSLGAAAILLAIIYLAFPQTIIGKGIFVISIGFVVLFIVSWRFCYTLILNRGMFNQNIIILGSGELAENIIEEIHKRKDSGYSLVAMALECDGPCLNFSEERDACLDNGKHIRVIPKVSYNSLCQISKELDVEKIVVALKERRDCLPTEELLKCRVNGIEVIEGNSFYEMLTGKLSVEHINPAWLIFSEGFQKTSRGDFLKRSTDIVISFTMLILLLPLIVIVAILIRLDSKEPEPVTKDIYRWFGVLCKEDNVSVGEKLKEIVKVFVKTKNPESDMTQIWHEFAMLCGNEGLNPAANIRKLVRDYIRTRKARSNVRRPVLFSQERMGKDGKNYQIYKFRSMIVNAERFSGPIWAGENDRRITRIGNILRKTRIDEIPQLWNVLKGEMSFVGPRPEREHFVRQLEKTIPYYRQRLTVKPGLTGWAQVSYGYGASEDDAKEKLNYDLFYIKNMSFLMDLMIVLKTVKIVIFGKGR